TRWPRDWSSDVCSSDLIAGIPNAGKISDFRFLGLCAAVEEIRDFPGIGNSGDVQFLSVSGLHGGRGGGRRRGLRKKVKRKNEKRSEERRVGKERRAERT